MNIYLKILFTTGIPFGIIMGLIYSVVYGIQLGLILGLFAGIFYGILMSLIVGSLHTRSIKQMHLEKPEDAYQVHQGRNIELQVSYDRAFNFCIASLNLIKNNKIRKEIRSLGTIDARSGMTWRTWGETISFDIKKIDDNRTQVNVFSRPFYILTIADYGKNYENVEKIKSFLKEESKKIYNK